MINGNEKHKNKKKISKVNKARSLGFELIFMVHGILEYFFVKLLAAEAQIVSTY